MNENNKGTTTNSGLPVFSNQASYVTNTNYTLLSDTYLVEKLAHFYGENISEYPVRSKGAGAHGVFEVTDDVTKYTCANFLNEVGKKTDIFTRFSITDGGRISSDSARNQRNFAIKFYTEDGNYDMVGNNIPVFFARDAIKLSDVVHIQKENPVINLDNPDAFWDFMSLMPESVHQCTILFTDRGTPASYRNMHGYASHAYMWYNEKGEYYWIKLHFRTNQGIKNLTRQEAALLSGNDPDHSTRDLFEHIDRGDYPSWDVYVQIMKSEDASTYRFDPFDVTKIWSQKDYPLIKFGKMILNRNPENYFSETEQAAFSTGNLVPGIAISPDKMLQGRTFSYPDTHRHRLGANFEMLPINAPKVRKNTYKNNGYTDTETYGALNYFSNSFDGVQPDKKYAVPPVDVYGMAACRQYVHSDMDFVQAGDLYGIVLNDREKANLVDNIVAHLGDAQERLQLRQSAIFYKTHPEYGTRVAEGLGLDVEKVKKLAAMSQEDRIKATT